MFIKLQIKASNEGIENEIQSLLNDQESDVFDTTVLVNVDDISHIINSNDGTSTIVFKSHDELMVTYTPHHEIECMLRDIDMIK